MVSGFTKYNLDKSPNNSQFRDHVFNIGAYIYKKEVSIEKKYFDLFRRLGYVVNANGRVKSHYIIADVKRFIEVSPSGHILLCSNNSLHFTFWFRQNQHCLFYF